jgi:hypothetical protein
MDCQQSELTHIDAPRTWGVQASTDPSAPPSTSPWCPDRTSSRLTIAVDFDAHGIGKLPAPLAIRLQAQKEMAAKVKALSPEVHPLIAHIDL